ncbi:unnamed protein product [Lathyrus oleraceus]
MPPPRQKEWWTHVTRVANGTKWQCHYCRKTRTGAVTKVKAHLTKCFEYVLSAEEVHNNIAAPSVNPHATVPSFDGEMLRLKQVIHELERDEHDMC